MSFETPLKLGKDSYVSISLVISMLLGAVWINHALNTTSKATDEVSQKLEIALVNQEHFKETSKLQYDAILFKIDDYKKSVDTAASDRWTGKDHAKFIEMLQELNPQMKVPKP